MILTAHCSGFTDNGKDFIDQLRSVQFFSFLFSALLLKKAYFISLILYTPLNLSHVS